jgi:O-antigen ligase
MDSKRVAIAAPQLPLVYLWLAPAIGVACIGTLAAAADLGMMAYVVLLLPVLACGGGFLILKAMERPRNAIACFLVFFVFVPRLNFRYPIEPDEQAFDLQNMIKVSAWIALFIVSVVRWRGIAPFLREPVVALAFAYASITLASTGWSEVPAFTGANALGLFVQLSFCCLLMVDLGENATIRIMVWSLLPYVALGVIGGALAPELTWLPPSLEESFYRLQGFSTHPNVFAQDAAVFTILALIARSKRLIGCRVFWGMLLLGGAVLLATGSRTTLAALLAATTLVALRKSRLLGRAVFAAAGILALALAWAALAGLPNLDNFLAGFSRTRQAGEILTLTMRTEIWEAVWMKICEKPLFGWGYNGTMQVLMDTFDKSSFHGSPNHAHNSFLQSLLSVGFLGSLPAFAWMFLLAYRFVTRPDPIRDRISLFTMVTGISEVGISGVPVLLSLVCMWALAREGAKRLPSATESFELATNNSHTTFGRGNLGLTP